MDKKFFKLMIAQDMKVQGIGFILMEKVIGKAKQLLLFQGDIQRSITTNYIEEQT